MSDWTIGAICGVTFVVVTFLVGLLFSVADIAKWDDRLKRGMFEFNGAIYKVEKVK